MVDLPDAPFNDWTLDEVGAAAEGEPVDVMPGSGRRVPGPRRKLAEAMQTAGVLVAGELDPLIGDRHLFSLTVWPSR
jgi:hypothetical protein